MSRDVFARIEGGKELRAKLRKLVASNVFLEDMRVFLDYQARRLLLLASRQEPRRQTGELAQSRMVVNRGSSKKRVRLAAAYTARGAAAAHEGVFHRAKLGERYARYKWFEKVLNGFEAGFYAEAAERLRALLARRMEER